MTPQTRDQQNKTGTGQNCEGALFDIPQPPDEIGPIQQSVINLLANLATEGLLSSKVETIGVALRQIAAAVDKGIKGGPKGVSVATSNLTKLLMESLAELPEPVRGQDPFYDALDEQLAALTKQALP